MVLSDNGCDFRIDMLTSIDDLTTAEFISLYVWRKDRATAGKIFNDQ